jgi:hypothetical protein
MDTWQILIMIVTAAWGTLVFLKLVADEADAVEGDLYAFQKREQWAKQKRLEEGTGPVLSVVGGG